MPLSAGRLLRTIAAYLRDARRDGRHSLRLLARAPGFTVAAALCLAIGTGLTAAMYSQVQSTVLAALPGGVSNSDELVRLQMPVSVPDYEELRHGATSVAQLAGYIGPVPVTLEADGGERTRVWGQLVTPEYFAVLGIRASVGRLFAAEGPAEDATAIVLGERLWRTRFGANPSMVGRSIRVNGQLVTVIGVASPRFVGAAPMTAAAELWISTTASPRVASELNAKGDRDTATMHVIGRLHPGVSPAQAESALEVIADRLEQSNVMRERAANERSVRILPGGRMFGVRDEDLPRTIGLPLVLVSLVLLMTCGNVANMVLARGVNRSREFAVRLSVGASRSRLVRQLLTESLILCTAGCVAGGAIAVWLLSLFDHMRSIIPAYVQYDVDFHWGAYLAAVAVATASTVLFSLLPSVRVSRLDIQTTLKRRGWTGARGARRFGLRNLVIYQQVAVSVVLILLTAFIVVGWRRAAGVYLGFNPEQLYSVSVDPIRDGFSTGDSADLINRLEQRFSGLPGVRAVSVAQTLPLAMSSSELLINARADVATGAQSLSAVRINRVGAGFFETVGNPLVHGRSFDRTDESNRTRILIVNEALARRVWGDANPVGQTLSLAGHTWEVVGVVTDMRSAFPLIPTVPAAFQPNTTDGLGAPSKHGVTLFVRVVPGVDGATLLRDELRSATPQLTVVKVQPLTDEVDSALFLARVATYTYGGMGVLALFLATIGLAGVTAYAVASRTRELGIRIALGAQRSQVLWVVLREGTAIILAGTITGLALALVVTRALSSVVEALAESTRTSLSDPLLLLGAPGLLVGLALIACYVPARRAIRIDPVIALRSE